MKKISFREFITAFALIIGGLLFLAVITAMDASAQEVSRTGNTFKAVSTRSTVKDTLVTKFEWEDSKGVKYPIIVNKASGRCYIYKVSGKTGKYYKMYMKPDVAMAVCKETGIEYVQK